MKREQLAGLVVGTITCLVLFQAYSHHKNELQSIARLPLKGAITPQSGNVTTRYQKGGMPLVHVAPQQGEAIVHSQVSDDAFSVPVMTPLVATVEPEPEPEPEYHQPASPWDAVADGKIQLQMISLIQGRRYAVINGAMVKRGDTVSVVMDDNKHISIRVADVKHDRVELQLEEVSRSFKLT